MTHAFALRVPLKRAATPAPETPARLARFRDRGWTVARLCDGVDAAMAGTAGQCETSGWVICGIAFLENRAFLSGQLGLSEDAQAATSDLQLLLDLRIALGDGFAQQVAGSFSVVFVNMQTGEVEAFRDHLGLYPFYYSVQDDALTCGSDLRAVMHLSGAALETDNLRIADFIQGEDIDLDRTIFTAAQRLPPAHHLRAGQSGVTAERYWQIGEMKSVPAEQGPDRLRDALKEAVATTMGSQGKIGAMLSGGLDSSSLAGLAAQSAETPLKTLSFVYGAAKAYDETRYIDRANATFGSAPHKIVLSAPPPLDALGPVIEEQMDLFLAPGLPKSRQIYAEARDLGLDALIDGHGGDEVISHGYGRLVELAQQRRFWQLYREARGAAAIHSTPFVALYAGHIARYSGLRAGHPLRRVLMKIARLQMRRHAISGWSAGPMSLIAPELRRAVDAEKRYAPDPLLQTEQDVRQAEKVMHLDGLTAPIMVQSFEVLHRSATAAGILPRYPFLDWRVVSLCLALPAEVKLREGRSRWVLREAMRGVLPDAIRLRSDKAEFGVEVSEAVMAFYRDKTVADFQPLADFVDVEAAEDLRLKVLAGDIRDTAAVRALWRLAVLLQWGGAFRDWRAAQEKGMLI